MTSKNNNNDELDKRFTSIIKYVILLIVLFIVIFLLFPFLNVKIWNFAIQESVISKNITIYKEPWVYFINPFNKTTLLPAINQKITFSKELTNNIITEKEQQDKVNVTLYWKSNEIQTNIQKQAIKTVLKWGYNIAIDLSISYNISNNEDSIKEIYKKSWASYNENILIPIIESTVADFFGNYSFSDLINISSNDIEIKSDELKSNINIRQELSQRLKDNMNNNWFALISFNLWQIHYSEELKTKIEEIFQKQKELLELRITKDKKQIEWEIIELTNINNSKQNEAIRNLIKFLNKDQISIDDYNKIKLINIVENKWNWDILPDNVSTLLK